ncbi:MAG: hypothetical protein ABR562_08010 [Thermoplasmatota archaeon]
MAVDAVTGILEAVACLRALAAHREAWPACLCRRDTKDDHVQNCHEAAMIQKWRLTADNAEAEYRGLMQRLDPDAAARQAILGAMGDIVAEKSCGCTTYELQGAKGVVGAQCRMHGGMLYVDVFA